MTDLNNFDYNNISAEQQSAVKALMLQLQTNGKLNQEEVNAMEVQFGVRDPDMMQVKDSTFYHLATAFGIFCSEEGFMTDMDKGLKVPMLRVNADMRKLDAFCEYIKINLQQRDEEELENQRQSEINDDQESRKNPELEISQEELDAKVAEEENNNPLNDM
tara:strand:+ start:909 stop:1391 length:483 start_codon:yes stop_codon:yes gene_type:complete